MNCKGKAYYITLSGEEHTLKGDIVLSINQFKTLNCKGKISFSNIKASEISLSGDRNIESLEAKNIRLCGMVHAGKLQAADINLSLHKVNEINQIECTNLNISHSALPSTDSIEALEDFMGVKIHQYISHEQTSIHLGTIIAKTVEVHNCHISELVCDNAKIVDCTIDDLTYKGSCDIGGDTVIKRQTRK